MAKNKTAEEKLKEYGDNIINSLQRWNDIKENGCNDPAWADGVNMNLVRNHIIYFKGYIMEICENNDFKTPEEYYLPTPPRVDNDFMANLKDRKRVERLRRFGANLTVKNIQFNSEQLTLF